jgi:hypothetical protein
MHLAKSYSPAVSGKSRSHQPCSYQFLTGEAVLASSIAMIYQVNNTIFVLCDQARLRDMTMGNRKAN